MNNLEGVACWIRGNINTKDHPDDSIREATIKCPYRQGQPYRSSLLGRDWDYFCTHPATTPETHGSPKVMADGTIVSGGMDDFATFCVPMDAHRRSLGEKSRLIIDAGYTVVESNTIVDS